jgi:pimeloyl-ACP methyl ester carboxylesterase
MSDVAIFGLVSFVVVAAAIVPLSFLVEEMRPVPATPERVSWSPDIPIRYVSVNGVRLRYIKTGEGPALVLLHTLRTQLDLFEKVVPELAKSFTVYAVDYPGHGYSDIPPAKYDPDYFVETIESFLEALDLHDVTLAGVSIGASICLILAARNNPRVSRVVAINPYDHAKGRGMARSSSLARLFVALADLPVLGDTVMRLRQFFIMRSVLDGGVSDPRHISPELLKEMYLVGNRRGHYRAFLRLLRNAESWETATKTYSNIKIPVLLLWGDRDWSRPDEREHDRQIVPSAKMATVEDGGHFLPLDRRTRS